MEKICRKCGVVLVAGDNWFESYTKRNNRICKRCQGILSKAICERNIANGMCRIHKDRPLVEAHTRCQPCLDSVRAQWLKSSSVPGVCQRLSCDKLNLKGFSQCEEHREGGRERSIKSATKQQGMKFHPEVPYIMLFQFQGGKCWLCGIKSNGRALHRDHDHVTGWVRGILCSSDNTILKSAGVDESVGEAEAYFIKHEMNQDRLLPILDYLENPPYFQLIKTLGLPVPTGTYEQYIKHYDLEEDI